MAERSRAHAKLLRSSEAVGLLAILADASSCCSSRPIWGKHRLCRFVPYSQTSDLSTERKVRHVIVKKVRFAPDVVEPTGDNRVYRGELNTSKETSKKTCGGKRQVVGSLDDAMSHPTAKSNCQKVLARPNLPVNRMLLYKGKLCYRSKMMPCL